MPIFSAILTVFWLRTILYPVGATTPWTCVHWSCGGCRASPLRGKSLPTLTTLALLRGVPLAVEGGAGAGLDFGVEGVTGDSDLDLVSEISLT